MFNNEFPGFGLNDPIWSNNITGYDANFDINSFNWNIAGPSQPYTGAVVHGNLNSYPDFFAQSTTPTSLYPGYGDFYNEGKSCCRPW